MLLMNMPDRNRTSGAGLSISQLVVGELTALLGGRGDEHVDQVDLLPSGPRLLPSARR